MVDFAGWEMPQQYTSVKDEHHAVRTAAGLFDVSHMGRYEIRGGHAAEFLQGLVTNDLDRVPAHVAQYDLMCTEDGGIVDDLVVYHPTQDSWSVVVNAANRAKDLAWLRDRAPDGIEVIDRSDELCLLALQGPKAADLLPVEGVDLSQTPFFGIRRARVAGIDGVISRTGYTGEDGFELFIPTQHAAAVWDALVELGAVPCGLAARDVCRLEAGLRLYGSDMDEQTNPYEAGLAWTVKLAKPAFVGREALERIKAAGPIRRLAGLRCTGRSIPRHGAAISRDGSKIGAVTSGTYSFWLGHGIAMAMLDVAGAPIAVGDEVRIDVRGTDGQAEIVPMPFYRGSASRVARA